MLISMSSLLLLLLLFVANKVVSILYLLGIDIDKDLNSVFYRLFYRSSFFN